MATLIERLIRIATPTASTSIFLTNFVVVDSSFLARVAYYSERTVLQIEFTDRTLYQYAEVPREIFADFWSAASKGEYFNRQIRHRFVHVKLETKPRS